MSFEEVMLQYIGGPTLLIRVAGLNILSDPTFDAAGKGDRLIWVVS